MRTFALLLSFCMVFSLAGCTDYGTKMQYGSVELYYTSGITKSEASALGEYLIRVGFDKNGERKTVQLAKSGNTYQFRLAVKKGLEQDQEYADIFKVFAGTLSEQVFNGADVEVHACDRYMKTLRVYLMRH